MLSEMWLYFFVLLSIYFVLKYLKTYAIRWGICAGLAVGYTYIIHNRSLAAGTEYPAERLEELADSSVAAGIYACTESGSIAVPECA